MAAISPLPLGHVPLERPTLDSVRDPSIADRLNTALRRELAAGLRDAGRADLAERAETIRPLSLAEDKDVTLGQLLQRELGVTSPIEKFPNDVTVGTLLQLDATLGKHPLFKKDASKASLLKVLQTSPALNTGELAAKFVDLYSAYEGRPKPFWQALRHNPDFQAPGIVDEIQLALQLTALTGNNQPLVQAIQNARQGLGVRSARDLGRLRAADWLKLLDTNIDGKAIEIPAHITGDTRDERAARYAAAMMETTKLAFPTDALRERIEQQPDVDLSLIRQVLARHPGLDVTRPLPATLDWGQMSAGDQTKAKASLETFRREIRMFPGLNYKTALEGSEARLENPVRKTVARVLANSPDFDLRTTHIDNYVAANGDRVFAGVPTQERPGAVRQLKSTQRAFRVSPVAEHVESLMGAGLTSAYGVANLSQSAFMKQFGERFDGTATALSVYRSAQRIAATAVNTYAIVRQGLQDVTPFVLGGSDANEKVQTSLKESPTWASLFGSLSFCECEDCRSVYSPAAYFVDLLQFIDTTEHATSGKTPLDVLLARRPDLEDIELSCENTTTTLPYVDLVNEILESYIATGVPAASNTSEEATSTELSVSREYSEAAAETADKAYETLAAAVYPFTLPFDQPLAIVRTYLEHLGTSRYDVMKAFQTADGPSDLDLACEYLKISAAAREVLVAEGSRKLREFYGYSADRVEGVSWTDHLAQTEEFLDRTGVSYEELVELSETRVLSGLDLGTVGAECDLSTTSIGGLSDARLSLLHRFVRLWRTLGCSIAELDKALHALAAADIDTTFLEKLALVQRLKSDLSVPLVQLLAFWAPIDTYGDEALYDDLFRNPTIFSPLDEAFELAPDGVELANPDQPFADHIPAILAALRISADDVALLLDDAGLTDESPLTLLNLSALYRRARLAGALDITVEEFVSLKTLTGLDPFPSGDPAATVAFVEKAQKVAASSFTVAQLDYLYRHVYETTDGLAPTADHVSQLVTTLRDGLSTIAAETGSVSDPTGDVLRQKLGVVLESSDVDAAMSLVDGTSTGSDEEKAELIEKTLTFVADAARAKEVLLAPWGTDAEERAARLQENVTYLLGELLDYLRDAQSRSFVKKSLASDLDLESDVIELLLDSLVDSDTTPGEPAMADFLALVSENATAPASYERLHKIALLAGTFELTGDEISYFSEYASAFADFDLNALPLDPSGFTTALFAQFERLYDYVTLRDALPESETTLLDVFGASDPSTALSTLAQATGWDSDEISILAGDEGFDLAEGDLKNEIKLVDFQDCIALIERTGISAEKLFAWAAFSPDADQARDVVSAVKAKYEDDQWLKIAKTLNNVLREQQRAALVAYLVPQLGVTDANELFEHFLIDLEMDPCMSTSRIKQALSSVQLFAQRCLMNLESDVSPESIDEDQWEWMKSYRVWEANRKVFLYPENWIEPELRDDKSPFFEELETTLLQNDLDEDTVEQAYETYLRSLDEISRLDICGMYRQQETEDEETTDILHVFGRTFTTPRVYYYRQLESGAWTAWEKLDLDIEGDHLIPVVYNRRLYLFWPIFTEKTDEAYEGSEEGSPPAKWEIALAWSEYQNGEWSSRQVSEDTLMTPEQGSRHQYLFRGAIESDALSIDVYYDPSDPKRSSNWPFDLLRVQLLGRFAFPECRGEVDTEDDDGELDLAIPYKSGAWYMTWRTVTASDLTLLSDNDNPAESRISLLEKIQGDYFQVVYPHQFDQFLFKRPLQPFFYQDKRRTYFVQPPASLNDAAVAEKYLSSGDQAQPGWLIGGSDELPAGALLGAATSGPGSGKVTSPDVAESHVSAAATVQFFNYFHPHVCAFIKALNRDGVDGLLTLDMQQRTNDRSWQWSFGRGQSPNATSVVSKTKFETLYDPTPRVNSDYPTEDVDFDLDSAYGPYNWELFFHAPLLIATRLIQEQKFEEARQWFHYIFNPTTDSSDTGPKRYWNFLPFYQEADAIAEGEGRIQNLLLALSSDDEEMEDLQAEVEAQIDAWREDPFNPHLIARMRSGAYQKHVVMKYLDNLVAWGDQLFSQDTIESINEATQLYVLAHKILGDRPERISATEVETLTYKEIAPKLDSFSNALISIENALVLDGKVTRTRSSDASTRSLGLGSSFYFCIPQNETLLAYWDTVDDRLYKIRHCMNIEGVTRELSLWESPIEPGLLVRAKALGVDLTSALSDVNAALPYYRFGYLIQKAQEFCAEVKSLGAALLAALEKKDAEALSALRAAHEKALLEAVKQVKEQQIEEAEDQLKGLNKTRDVVQYRHDYWSGLSRRSTKESTQIQKLEKAQGKQKTAGQMELAAAALALIPDLTLGFEGLKPVLHWTKGGIVNLAGTEAIGKAFGSRASLLSYEAQRVGLRAGWERRTEEWDFQEASAKKELDQIDEQIAAATIRVAIAKADLENQEKQIEQAEAVEEFLTRKYTNTDLYTWMVSEISTVYFQAYQLAYDLARRAERAFRFERGLTSSSYVRFGYWDSLKKGLLSGERLSLDLRRLEMAYMDQNRREYEITKHISLVLHDPLALMALKETGRSIVTLPEALFDIDYPGHYLRRLKTVSLTIPCVTGPYTSINCTLTLLASRIRVDASLDGGYQETDDDDRFLYNFAAVQSIATSHAQNDTGMFELSFRDERYLPFEGGGAVSEWRIDLPRECNALDFDTISDVILRLHYTARDGGELMRKAALAAAILPAPAEQDTARRPGEIPAQANLQRLFSIRHEYPNEWHRFLNPNDASAGLALQIALTTERFPYRYRGKDLEIETVEAFLDPDDADGSALTGLTLSVTPPDGSLVAGTVTSNATYLNGLPYVSLDVSGQGKGTGTWTFSLKATGAVDTDALADLILICHYSAT